MSAPLGRYVSTSPILTFMYIVYSTEHVACVPLLSSAGSDYCSCAGGLLRCKY